MHLIIILSFLFFEGLALQASEMPRTNAILYDPSSLIEKYNNRVQQVATKQKKVLALARATKNLVDDLDQSAQHIAFKKFAATEAVKKDLNDLESKASSISLPALIDTAVSEEIEEYIRQEDRFFSGLLKEIHEGDTTRYTFSPTEIFEMKSDGPTSLMALLKIQQDYKSLGKINKKLNLWLSSINKQHEMLYAARDDIYKELCKSVKTRVFLVNSLYQVNFRGLLEHPLCLKNLMETFRDFLTPHQKMVQFLANSSYYKSICTDMDKDCVQSYNALSDNISRSHKTKTQEWEKILAQKPLPYVMADLKNYCCFCRRNLDLDTDNPLSCVGCNNALYCSPVCKTAHTHEHAKFCSQSYTIGGLLFFTKVNKSFVIADMNQSNYTSELIKSDDSENTCFDTFVLRNTTTNESFNVGIYDDNIFFAESSHRNYVILIASEGFSRFLLYHYIHSTPLSQS